MFVESGTSTKSAGPAASKTAFSLLKQRQHTWCRARLVCTGYSAAGVCDCTIERLQAQALDAPAVLECSIAGKEHGDAVKPLHLM